MINPCRPIPPEASAVHHIVDDDVTECPTFDRFMQTIGLPDADYYCAHNSRFDAGFLPPTLGPWIDTYRSAIRLVADAPRYSNQVLRYNLGLKVDRELPVHRVRGDVETTAALLCYLVEYARACLARGGEIGGVTDLAALAMLAEHATAPALLRVVGFGKHAGQKWSEVPRDYLRWILSQPQDAFDEDVRFTAERCYNCAVQ